MPNTRDPTLSPGYSARDRKAFRSARSPRYEGDDPDHHHSSDRASLWERLGDMSSMAPVHGNPSLDPAGEVINVSEMAGYNAGAHSVDHTDGPDKLVTGEADGNKFLEAPSKTEGGPLQLAPDESCFEYEEESSSDDSDADGDWCGWL